MQSKKTRFKGIVQLGLCGLLWLAVVVPAYAEDSVDNSDERVEKLREKADTMARKSRFRKAVPLYKELLQLRPYDYPAVYYNLAEISRALENYNEAALLYRRYLQLDPEASDKRAIERAIKTCEKKLGKTANLNIEVVGPDELMVVINGMPLGDRTKTNLIVAEGKYKIKVTGVDFKSASKAVQIKAGDTKALRLELEKELFYGSLRVETNVEGAQVFVAGKEVGKTPLDAQKLEVGKQLIELKKEGYHRWVRNVIIGRNEEYLLEVSMQKQKNE